MPITILRIAGKPPTRRNSPTQNASSAEAENLCFRLGKKKMQLRQHHFLKGGKELLGPISKIIIRPPPLIPIQTWPFAGNFCHPLGILFFIIQCDNCPSQSMNTGSTLSYERLTMKLFSATRMESLVQSLDNCVTIFYMLYRLSLYSAM